GAEDRESFAARWRELEPRLETASLETAGALFRNIVELRDRAAVPRLAAILSDPASPLLPMLLETLEGWDEPELLEPLARLLDDPDFPCKRHVVAIVARYKSSRAAQVLASAAADRDPAVRAAAVTALAAFQS